MLKKIANAIIEVIIGKDEALTSSEIDTSGRPMAHAQDKLIRNALRQEQREELEDLLRILK